MRNRLVELLDIIIHSRMKTLGEIADLLLANGVIVPPCKVGQTVWYVDKGAERVKPIKVISYEICNSGKEEFGCWGGDFTPTRFHVENIGKTVFLTRQEAEQSLKGGAE